MLEAKIGGSLPDSRDSCLRLKYRRIVSFLGHSLQRLGGSRTWPEPAHFRNQHLLAEPSGHRHISPCPPPPMKRDRFRAWHLPAGGGERHPKPGGGAGQGHRGKDALALWDRESLIRSSRSFKCRTYLACRMREPPEPAGRARYFCDPCRLHHPRFQHRL